MSWVKIYIPQREVFVLDIILYIALVVKRIEDFWAWYVMKLQHNVR